MNELFCTDVENAWKLVKINMVSNEPEVSITPRRFHIWFCGSSWKTNSYTFRKLAVSYPKHLKPEKKMLHFILLMHAPTAAWALPFAPHLVHRKGSKLAFSEFCWNTILPWKLKKCEGQKAEYFSFLTYLLPDLLYFWDLSQTIKAQETEAYTCSTKSVSTMAVEQGSVISMRNTEVCVSGGRGKWIPVTSHPNCSGSTTSAVRIQLLFDTCCLPWLRSPARI